MNNIIKKHHDAVVVENNEPICWKTLDGMSAKEYLAQVSRQAKSMPDLFMDSTMEDKPDNAIIHSVQSFQKSTRIQKKKYQTTPIIDGSAASMSYLLSHRTMLIPPPSPQHLPYSSSSSSSSTFSNNIEHWVKNIIIANFERLREYQENCQIQGIGGKQSNRMCVPPLKERTSWYTFCIGGTTTNETLAEDTSSKDNIMQKTENNGIMPQEDVTPTSWSTNLSKLGNEPTIRLLLQMDQVMIRRVLSHLAYHVKDKSNISYTSAEWGRLLEWIYALLSRFEKPIHRDDAVILFRLLKDLCWIRSKVDCDKDVMNANATLAQLNVLIVLIGVFFEQGGGISGVMTCRQQK